jgi:hypothetical protein
MYLKNDIIKINIRAYGYFLVVVLMVELFACLLYYYSLVPVAIG